MSAPRRLTVALLLLALIGVAVRLRGVTAPPFDFHPTRQYYALLFAQDYRHALCGDARSPEALAARENRQGESLLEPPVVPAVTAAGWCALGDESTALPRVLAAVVWCSGAFALGLLVRSLGGGAVASLFAAAWMLFHPYAIAAGRSVQPDGPMVALLLAGGHALARWLDAGDRRWMRAAALFFGAAVFVKLVAIFFVGPLLAAAFLPFGRDPRSERAGVRSAAWFVGSMVPAALWYADGWWGHGFLRAQGQGRFQPQLLGTAHFWRELSLRLDAVVGLAALGLAVVAMGLAMRGRARAFALAWFAGQAALGVAFTFHVHTHDYYCLPLVPWVGMGLGLAAEALVGRLPRGRSVAAITALAVASMLGLRATRSAWRDADLAVRDAGTVVQDAARIGAAVGHDRDVLMQARWYGLPTKFHGRFAAEYWPDHLDLAGDPNPWSPSERMARAYHGRRFGWFVLADTRERTLQPALWEHLVDRHPVVLQTQRVIVFRLVGPSSLSVTAPPALHPRAP